MCGRCEQIQWRVLPITLTPHLCNDPASVPSGYSHLESSPSPAVSSTLCPHLPGKARGHSFVLFMIACIM